MSVRLGSQLPECSSVGVGMPGVGQMGMGITGQKPEEKFLE